MYVHVHITQRPGFHIEFFGEDEKNDAGGVTPPRGLGVCSPNLYALRLLLGNIFYIVEE